MGHSLSTLEETQHAKLYLETVWFNLKSREALSPKSSDRTLSTGLLESRGDCPVRRLSGANVFWRFYRLMGAIPIRRFGSY